MKVLVAGFSPQSTAAVEIIVGSLWPSASFVKLARGATFAPPEQAPEAQQCDICVVDLLGLGMAIWAPEHEVELQAFLGDRRAVLFVPAGSDEGWPSALAALGPARVVLQHPASTAALREALATLRGDHRSDGESESGQEDISETVRGSDGQSAGPDVVTTGRQAESGSSTVGEGAADEAAESSVGAAATFQRDDLALENVVEPVSSASDSGEVAQWPTEGSLVQIGQCLAIPVFTTIKLVLRSPTRNPLPNRSRGRPRMLFAGRRAHFRSTSQLMPVARR